MGTIDVQNRNRPLDLETYYNQKEPAQPPKEQSTPSDTSQEQDPYLNVHSHTDYWDVVPSRNNANPMALAQGKTGKAQKRDPAKGSAPVKSVAVDVEKLRRGDTFILGPPQKNSYASSISVFTVTGRVPIDRRAIQSSPEHQPTLQQFSEGEGPFHEVHVSYPIIDGATKIVNLHQDVWYYDKGSNLWGFFDNNNEFQISNIGPQGRVIKGFVPSTDAKK